MKKYILYWGDGDACTWHYYRPQPFITDDTEDMLKEQEQFFVVTNGYVGLTLKDAKRAVEILNKTN